MPIPPLDSRGLLPEGTHLATLKEVQHHFANTLYRQDLWRGFLLFVDNELSPKGLLAPLVIAGSFLSDKQSPSDIEVLLKLEEAPPAQISAGVLLYLEHDKLKEKYRVDYYPGLKGQNDFSAFFQYVGPKTAQQKGLGIEDKRGIIKVEQWTLG